MMLEHLKLTNVGPAPVMELEFGPRLNILTGDNGLGKSFLLDIAWFVLTRRWPAEVNPKLTSGKMARPSGPKEASITYSFSGKTKSEDYDSTFLRQEQAWSVRPGRPTNPGLVLYAQVDGGFAVWDPARNYWRTRGIIDVQDRPPAYVFSPPEVWNGLEDDSNRILCNGLIRDWAGWQMEKGQPFANLSGALEALSPSDHERITPGKPTRVSLDDVRDIPTLKMPYGQEVPVIHASAGMKRILSLAYLLVWAWEEHQRASRIIQKKPTGRVILLVDEIESHLHPRWQRRIVKALLGVMGTINRAAEVQVLLTTHSPLVMAAVEPEFDPEKDAWFDLDLVQDEKGPARVELTKRPFARLGDASNWLTSEAFGLASARSLEAEAALEKAARAMSTEDFDATQAQQIDALLRTLLGDTDPFWIRWRFVAEKKGWLS